MNHSLPGLPVHHQLPESAQTHVHCVSDAIQPSHPLSSPSPPALNLSQHQGLFLGLTNDNSQDQFNQDFGVWIQVLVFASFVAQLVKNLPAGETCVQSLGWEDPLEKGKSTHSSILACRIPWTIQSIGWQRVGHK